MISISKICVLSAVVLRPELITNRVLWTTRVFQTLSKARSRMNGKLLGKIQRGGPDADWNVVKQRLRQGLLHTLQVGFEQVRANQTHLATL